jgi:hypothetical protein
MARHKKEMRTFGVCILLYLVGLMGILSSIMLSQEEKSQDPSSYQLKIPVDLAIVPVTVKDVDGNIVTGLQKSDCLLEEDGVQ